MKRVAGFYGGALGVMVLGAMLAAPAAGRAEGGAEDVLYSDADGQSSATIVQVLPNAPSTQMILTNVKSIRVRQDILIITWGGSATTLLPKQYVSEVTVNKRLAPAAPPTAAPVPSAATAPARQ